MNSRSRRRRSPRRRSDRWAVVIAVMVAAIGGQGYPVAAQWTVTPAWSDVTPGRVTVEPWGVSPGEDTLIAVVTEDRRLRLRDSRGAVVAATRTGLREPIGVLREGSDYSLLIPPRSNGAPMVRVDLFGASPRVVGQPRSVDSVIAGEARFIVADGESLIYTVSATGLVTHASTAGGVLWRRRLPTAPTAVVAYRGAVYVALADGRLFRFDGNGTGVELVRFGAPVVAMQGVGTVAPALLTVDGDGALTLLTIAEEGSDSVSVQWRVPVGADRAAEPASAARTSLNVTETPARQDRSARIAVTPPRGRSESWYAAVTDPAGAVAVVDSTGDVRAVPLPAETSIDMVRTGRIPSGGFFVVSGRQLLLLSDTGVILDEVELSDDPATATWIDGIGQLILTYGDWSIEAWAVAAGPVEPLPLVSEWSPPVPGGQRHGNAVSPGALSARAEAVFRGTSRSERSALLSEIQGQRRRAVLFDRVGEARSILRRLVRETLESPQVDEGRVRNDFPGIRRAAVEELGRYLDRTSREVLTDVVRHDPDAQVVAAALHAFARFGIDEAGITAHAVERFRRSDDRDRTALAPAMIEFLELTSATQRYPAAAEEALDLLIESNLSRDIRRRAATIERARYR